MVSRDGVTSTDYRMVTCSGRSARPGESFPTDIQYVNTCTFTYDDGTGTLQSTTGYTIWAE